MTVPELSPSAQNQRAKRSAPTLSMSPRGGSRRRSPLCGGRRKPRELHPPAIPGVGTCSQPFDVLVIRQCSQVWTDRKQESSGSTGERGDVKGDSRARIRLSLRGRATPRRPANGWGTRAGLRQGSRKAFEARGGVGLAARKMTAKLARRGTQAGGVLGLGRVRTKSRLLSKSATLPNLIKLWKVYPSRQSLAPETVRKYAEIAARYEIGIRIPNLSFKHHQLVAWRDDRLEWLESAGGARREQSRERAGELIEEIEPRHTAELGPGRP